MKSVLSLLIVYHNDLLSGIFARDPSVMHRVGHVLLNLKQVEPKRTRRCIIADDLFQLSKAPKKNILSVVCKVIKDLKGCKFQACSLS